jgi:hypothetical protein
VADPAEGAVATAAAASSFTAAVKGEEDDILTVAVKLEEEEEEEEEATPLAFPAGDDECWWGEAQRDGNPSDTPSTASSLVRSMLAGKHFITVAEIEARMQAAGWQGELLLLARRELRALVEGGVIVVMRGAAPGGGGGVELQVLRGLNF